MVLGAAAWEGRGGRGREQAVRERGGRKAYRLQTEGAGDRHNAKLGNRATWFKGKGSKTVEGDRGWRLSRGEEMEARRGDGEGW